MPYINLRNHTFTLNDQRIEGWADEDDALTIPSITLANVTRGADGKLQASTTGNLGGPVEVKLLATSASVKYMSGYVSHVQNGGRVVFQGVLTDHSNGTVTTMTNGVLTDVMPGPSLGGGAASTVTYTIEFETIIANYDAAESLTGAPVDAADFDDLEQE